MEFTRVRAAYRRTACTLAAVASAALLTGGVLASPASASGPFTSHLVPENTGYLALDVSGASTAPGASVIDWWSDAERSEDWTFEPIFQPANIYEIVNGNSGQCLTTNGVAGAQLFQLPCDRNNTNQDWISGLQAPPNDQLGQTIKNLATQLYVDINGDSPWPGAAAITWYSDGGPNQLFAAY